MATLGTGPKSWKYPESLWAELDLSSWEQKLCKVSRTEIRAALAKSLPKSFIPWRYTVDKNLSASGIRQPHFLGNMPLYTEYFFNNISYQENVNGVLLTYIFVHLYHPRMTAYNSLSTVQILRIRVQCLLLVYVAKNYRIMQLLQNMSVSVRILARDYSTPGQHQQERSKTTDLILHCTT